MRSMRRIRNCLLAATSIAAVMASSGLAEAQPAPTGSGSTYEPAMVEALAGSLGISKHAAVQRLDDQHTQQQRLDRLRRDGVETDGTYFTDGRLTLNVTGRSDAERARHAGLSARVPERGARALEKITDELDARARDKTPSGVVSWSADLSSDTVVVKVADAGRDAATRTFLAAAREYGKAVRIEKDTERLAVQRDVYPGSRMNLNNDPGSWCSVGFGATSSSGTEYLVTAGHCIENLPGLYFDGSRFAKGTTGRFHVGEHSVDMGVARVDSGWDITPTVGTWGSTGNVAVRGSNRAPVGADLCKSGSTTGWTCGSVEGYDVSVTYTDRNGGPDTVVTGLGSSTVCTEGGDSGGAYISGNQAQGMTSGGPIGQTCGGVYDEGHSYFQPLDDALSYYDLDLTTR
ncbi:serine protease [Streptomyces qinglanensis]|uniref:Serine protease n=1 Tax=Streptomyces qinglanensis TaxID=943816 RepID=A0A1E7K6R6_9ACTN|nr:S1 family peptidase [Streptomyces qinglanensis]OEU99575.1 serine protease [Streptomyces qinglanensis]OEV23620.1 serine protease [Streptomyces nanshensis]